MKTFKKIIILLIYTIIILMIYKKILIKNIKIVNIKNDTITIDILNSINDYKIK